MQVAETTTRSSSYKWLVVGMLWCVCFLNYADRQAIFSIFPKLKEAFGFDTVELGVIGSAFMWIYAFGAPVAGYVGDRVRRKELILGGCLFWSCVTVCTSVCAKLWQFVAVRALEGFGETFYFPASMSLISDYHSGATRSRAMAFHQSSVYAGTIAGSWIAALLAEHYGWRSGFFLFGGCGILLVIALFAFLREPQRGTSDETVTGERASDSHPEQYSTKDPAETTGPQPSRSTAQDGNSHDATPVLEYATSIRAGPMSIGETCRALFTKPSVILLMLAFLGANFVATIFLTWTPTFLVDKFGFKLASAGLSGTLFIHLASAVSAPLGGLIADKLTKRHPGGRMIVQAVGLLLGSVFVAILGTTHDVTTLLISMTVFGFGKGLYDSNIFASLYDAIEPRARSTAAGVMNTVGWGGGALGPLVVGWLAKHGRGTEVENMSRAIAGTSVIYVIAAIVLLVVAFVTIRADAVQSVPSQLAARS